MADKENSPAQPEAGAGNDAATGSTAASGQANAPEEAASLKAALEAERKKRIEGERSYAELRSRFNSKDQELASLRALRSRILSGQGEDTEGAEAVQDDVANEVLATREEVAWMRFRQEHPNYSEYWDEMKGLAGDPNSRGNIESYRVVNGRPVLNTFATLHNAYNEVHVRRLEKAQKELAGRKAVADTKNSQLKSQAFISGDGAASEESGAAEYGIPLNELLSMEYDQIIKDPRYQRFIDKNDPPRGIN
jgi:hypothetical protein